VIDLKPYDELDPDYQASSARVFFQRHYDAMAFIREVLEFGPDTPGSDWPLRGSHFLAPKLRGRLANRQRVVGIGLEVWDPPPGKAH
jgi:hypothetical protein